MTPEFLKEFDILMQDEGAYSNNPKDPGGETKWGFSRRWNPDIPDAQWATWSREDSKQRAWDRYWSAYRLDEIKHRRIQHQLFNMGFLCGMKPIVMCLQKVLNKLGEFVTVDGIIGKETISAVNRYRNEMALDAAMESEIAQYLMGLPKKNAFINGWLSRNDRDWGENKA
ncbi:glycosyl hydrolase 108 family protein [Desulfatirhabdium butyrativorans]|uniref:glycosyl hydrolase 108 family protein n=1 Tax=Desulfatirhabdium butyrativorans TaxID=340467 RepID=UPI00041796A1|nr:glycosyl hydrolase 108 family protein [Desulfatirhabdium butyrativorans]